MEHTTRVGGYHSGCGHGNICMLKIWSGCCRWQKDTVAECAPHLECMHRGAYTQVVGHFVRHVPSALPPMPHTLPLRCRDRSFQIRRTKGDYHYWHRFPPRAALDSRYNSPTATFHHRLSVLIVLTNTARVIHVPSVLREGDCSSHAPLPRYRIAAYLPSVSRAVIHSSTIVRISV